MPKELLKDIKKDLMKDVEDTLFPSNITIGRTALDKTKDALAKLFIPEHDTDGVPAFRGIREAYISLTGDKEFQGQFWRQNASPELRSVQDFSSSSFTYALQNALSMYLSKEYKRFPYHEDILISDKKEAKDLRSVHSVGLEYFADLPDVDPETEDWYTLEPYVDMESEYDMGQKGTLIWVTRKTIINDSIGIIKAMLARIARAARRTHAKFVWNFFINNSNCPDGTAWFTGGHGNLGTNALDFNPLVTAITALANMTEPGSGEKLGLDLADFTWWLVIPIDLWDLAVQKNQTKSYYTGNDLTTKVPNPVYQLFGEHNERIAVIPFFSDANDWGVIRDREDIPIIEMSYLEGREEPDIIVAELEMLDPVLSSEKYGYKARHEYGGTLADYRGGYKSEVA